MSYRRSRKRRRSQAFPADDGDEDENVEGAKATNKTKDAQEENGEDGDEVLSELFTKEAEIWEAFREEHYEAIEQLPLSLHRQYTLLRELDEQAQGYNRDLLPTLKRYVQLRRSLVSRLEPGASAAEQRALGVDLRASVSAQPQRETVPKSEPPPTPIQNLAIPLNGSGSAHPFSRHSVSPTKDQGSPGTSFTPAPVIRANHIASLYMARTPTPMSIPPNRIKPPQTTRGILSHIAWLSEEVQRASDEKVNLAQAAYDSVDRHIRLLDQSIREQEASISLGVRPGTHLAPILLPEVIVPGSRPARVEPNISAVDDGDNGMTLGMVDVDGADEVVQPQRRGRAGKKARPKPRNRNKKEVEVDDASAATNRSRGGGIRSLKLNGPVPQAPPVNVNEEIYCYCKQGSYGEMVACDNENCLLEWFHLGCVGLEKPPEDNESWYCRDCQHHAKMNKSSKLRKRKRR